MVQIGRYIAAKPPTLAAGWRLDRLTPMSNLFGANGMRIGSDGRIYVAQCVGSTISAIDADTGAVETVVPQGGDIVGPDDLAFDDSGNLYATEFMDGRVSVQGVDGRTRVVRGDVPGANGITFHQGRLYIDECRLGGRLLELDLNGGAPRVVAENLQLPNALSPGPDGLLYFPTVGAGEIWRVDPKGGTPERVVADLHHPVAVKFDSKGFIVSPQGGTGEVLRIDPRTGARTVIATLDPGLDNLTFKGDRLFVSHMTNGRITEVLADGKSREVLPGGFHGPFGIAMADDGKIYICDHVAFYALTPGQGVQMLARMFDPGYPNGVRCVAAMGGGNFAVSNWSGTVARYRPYAKEHDVLAEGLDLPYGVAATSDGAVVVAERGAGRVLSLKGGQTTVLAKGLSEPVGVAVADGACFVSELGAGRVVKVTGSGTETVLDGLKQPQGLAARAGTLYVVDAGAHAVIAHDIARKTHTVIASNLPVGAPPGITPKPLRGTPPFSGPFGPFAGIAAGGDGTLYVSADTEGSVIALRPS